MVIIKALEHVPNCYSRESGAVIFGLVQTALKKDGRATVSFAGVSDVPSSFVNAALIPLLDQYSFEFIRSNLSIIESNRQINEMIRRRFEAESSKRQSYV
jgi:hypothetical protein